MNTRHILMRAAEGAEPYQIDAAALNVELATEFGSPSATTWAAFHNDREAIVDLHNDAIDEQAVRDVITAHVNGKAARDDTKRRQAIKLKARAVIVARYPDWKQANMTARMVELSRLERLSGLLPAEQTEFDALYATWTWVQLVRSTSDVAEVNGTAPDAVVWPD